MIGISERGKLGTYETSRCRPLDGKAGKTGTTVLNPSESRGMVPMKQK